MHLGIATASDANLGPRRHGVALRRRELAQIASTQLYQLSLAALTQPPMNSPPVSAVIKLDLFAADQNIHLRKVGRHRATGRMAAGLNHGGQQAAPQAFRLRRHR